MQIDAMSLAQMKRQLAWETEELRHLERDSQSASLALENAKKKVEEYKKKQITNPEKETLYYQNIKLKKSINK